MQSTKLDSYLGLLKAFCHGGEDLIELARAVLPATYASMATVLAKEGSSAPAHQVELLTEGWSFTSAKDVVFGDDSELRDVFLDLPYVYAPVDPPTVAPLFRFLGVPILSERVRRNRRIPRMQPLPLDLGDEIRAICRKVAERLDPHGGGSETQLGWAERAACLEVYVCDEIKLQYVLDMGRIRRQRTLYGRCEYDRDHNELYVDKYVEPFDNEYADGLCRMFDGRRREAYVELVAMLREARHAEAKAMAYQAVADMPEEDATRLIREGRLPSSP